MACLPRCASGLHGMKGGGVVRAFARGLLVFAEKQTTPVGFVLSAGATRRLVNVKSLSLSLSHFMHHGNFKLQHRGYYW